MRRALLVILVTVTACGAASGNRFKPLQDVPDDVIGVIDDTWARAEPLLGALLPCLGDVGVALVRSIPDGDASYDRPSRVIAVEIPTSPARFSESLVHELGHHLEAECHRELDEIRERFLVTQGLPADSAWSSAATWEQIPSEHFAETMVLLVNGGRLLHEDIITISPATLKLVREWSAG